EDVENCLDSELWHACAGVMVQMPPVNSKVFYFPQGHAEHALSPVDFAESSRIPAMILCKVDRVKYLADPDTDEVYARIRLVPDIGNELCTDEVYDDGGGGGSAAASGSRERQHTSFAKTLTQSDANNGGGFSVPRYCAETIFPPLDFTADPPVQNVIARDVHGETFRFRHIYRGTPRRHLLTTGWSSFVNQKKLVAGDSIVFWRADNGGLCVGIRRAKKNHSPHRDRAILSRWNSAGVNGFSSSLEPDNMMSLIGSSMADKPRVKPESVIEAAYLAVNSQPFEVEYHPRLNTPEFCIKASSVISAMKIQWFSGMRFKMPFETEDSSKISWFMGTVASVQISDPIRWPNSPWRMLQVAWDEPDLLQNVNSVSPWLVEMVVSGLPLPPPPPPLSSPFLQPRKKMRLIDFPLDATTHYGLPSFTGRPQNSCVYLQEAISSAGGIQGARHVRIPFPQPLSTSNFLDAAARNHRPKVVPRKKNDDSSDADQNVGCLLSIGNNSHMAAAAAEKTENQIRLFGKPISIDRRKSSSPPSSETTTTTTTRRCCKVFLDSEDAGKSLDLPGIGSYEEMYARLEEMFELVDDVKGRVFYCDSDDDGVVKWPGDVPYSEFAENAKRVTVLTDPGNNDSSER
ncbi:hypothetical protein M569_15753, partial [Genlisea aurea]